MMNHEKREHPRHSPQASFLIYGSGSIIAYTVDLKDISKSGAFIKTKHLLQIGEEISFDIINDVGLKVIAGHGRVARIEKAGSAMPTGFGIRFATQLSGEVETSLAMNNA